MKILLARYKRIAWVSFFPVLFVFGGSVVAVYLLFSSIDFDEILRELEWGHYEILPVLLTLFFMFIGGGAGLLSCVLISFANTKSRKKWFFYGLRWRILAWVCYILCLVCVCTFLGILFAKEIY